MFDSSKIESAKIGRPRDQGVEAVIIAADQGNGNVGHGLRGLTLLTQIYLWYIFTAIDELSVECGLSM